MKLIKSDFVPRLADAGLDDIILNAFAFETDVNGLRMRINKEHPELDIDNDEILHYIAERGGLGLTLTGREMPPATPRPDAPGLKQTARAVSIVGDVVGAVRWYVNGKWAMSTSNTGRMLKTDLGAKAGDIVQVALVDKDVVGWWGRVEVE